jgi:hypothetical protein
MLNQLVERPLHGRGQSTESMNCKTSRLNIGPARLRKRGGNLRCIAERFGCG